MFEFILGLIFISFLVIPAVVASRSLAEKEKDHKI